MSKEEIIEFIKEYSECDVGYIECDISKEDVNYDFRISVCEIAKNNFSICSDKLIIDLYISLSNSSKKTFGVYKDYSLFANEILNRGHLKYFEIYMEGAYQSFDTIMASGIIQLEKKKIVEIIEYLEKMTNKEKYKHMLSRFQWLLNKS